MKSFATFMVIAMVVLGTALTASAQAPANIWFEADAISGLTNGEAVATWPDSSGNGNDLVSITNAPTYKTGVVNGKPVLDFAGGGIQMGAPSDSSMNHTSFTAFAVLKYGNLAVTESMFFRGNDPNTGILYAFMGYAWAGGTEKRAYVQIRKEDGVGGSDQAGCIGGTDTGVTAFHVHTGWFDKSLLPDSTSNIGCFNLYRDGTLDIAGSPYHLCQADITLGATTSGGLMLGWQGIVADPRYFEGQVAEIAVIPYAGSAQDILDVNAYLGAKYGITVAGGGDAGNGYTILAGTAVSGNPGTLIYGK